jgi:hypothetical protein
MENTAREPRCRCPSNDRSASRSARKAHG